MSLISSRSLPRPPPSTVSSSSSSLSLFVSSLPPLMIIICVPRLLLALGDRGDGERGCCRSSMHNCKLNALGSWQLMGDGWNSRCAYSRASFIYLLMIGRKSDGDYDDDDDRGGGIKGGGGGGGGDMATFVKWGFPSGMWDVLGNKQIKLDWLLVRRVHFIASLLSIFVPFILRTLFVKNVDNMKKTEY